MEISLIEEWRDVPGYEGIYKASSLGNIRKIGKSKNKKLTLASSGYLVTTLSKGGNYKSFLVHRLICAAFNGTKVLCKNRDFTIDHENEVRTDNRPENLREISQRENASRSREKGEIKFLGVTYKSGKYRSCIRVKKRLFHLGYYFTPEAAHEAYLKALEISKKFSGDLLVLELKSKFKIRDYVKTIH